ncbi:DUF3558 domain-containing protein [Rhodococcus spongiicola]|uniref:DUF3558 domain-containing protein n=1 Tax=Rhodococcus spongiicola TaxID=2487352 RepID=A0A438AV48_9NOCA|nr:DUF3558 domain-containing protein [Rhodococcus spongiicola]RVW02559.1 DUF3558 domain-containing protein [Rhodococcus spongiicola]
MGRRGGAIVATVSVLVLAGCGSTSEGQAETKAQSEEPVFDPCSIPEDVLLAIGVDPATEERDIMGVKQPGWSLCSWNDSDVSFFVTIFATGRPLDTIRTNERAIDVTPIDLPGRDEAFTFREKSDTRNEHCDVLVAAGPDTLMLRTDFAKGLPPSESPCPQAIENAKLLEPSLPR